MSIQSSSESTTEEGRVYVSTEDVEEGEPDKDYEEDDFLANWDMSPDKLAEIAEAEAEAADVSTSV